LPLLVGLLCYTGILVLGGRVLGDPDTYWHIAVGRWIIEHRAVMHQDVFSFSMPGAPFTPPEWLAEVLIAWIYDHFGWAGLVASTAFCVAAAMAMLLRVLLRMLSPVHALIATLLTAAVVAPHVLARPHIFTLPILVTWTAALVRARTEHRAPPRYGSPR
jgi:chromate transport protein ChrA